MSAPGPHRREAAGARTGKQGHYPSLPVHPLAPCRMRRKTTRVAIDAIAQDVRPDGGHLALPIAGVTATMGKFGKAVGQFDKPFPEPRGGGRVERFDISDDRL